MADQQTANSSWIKSVDAGNQNKISNDDILVIIALIPGILFFGGHGYFLYEIFGKKQYSGKNKLLLTITSSLGVSISLFSLLALIFTPLKYSDGIGQDEEGNPGKILTTFDANDNSSLDTANMLINLIDNGNSQEEAEQEVRKILAILRTMIAARNYIEVYKLLLPILYSSYGVVSILYLITQKKINLNEIKLDNKESRVSLLILICNALLLFFFFLSSIERIVQKGGFVTNDVLKQEQERKRRNRLKGLLK